MSHLEVAFIPEPTLVFRYDQQLEYSRDGLYLYGPVDATDTPRQIRYGFIGTKDGLGRFERWAKQVPDSPAFSLCASNLVNSRLKNNFAARRVEIG